MLQFSFPFLKKSIQIFFHKFMSFFGYFLSGFCIHPIFKKQSFFKEMIDCRASTFQIFLFRHVVYGYGFQIDWDRMEKGKGITLD